MDTSLVSAFFSAQLGSFQLAVAARLDRADPNSGTSVAKLVNAVQQNFAPLASAAADIGTNLDISV